MKTITKQYLVYTFSELHEDIQDKVIENLYDINVDSEYWYEYAVDELREDLKENYGIEFANVYFDIDQGSYAWLDKPYVSDIYKFLKKAGFDLRTKEAKELIEHHYIYTTHYGRGSAKNWCDNDKLSDCIHSRLEDFISMLREQWDYCTSREAIIETIEANEYTFLENGKMFNC